MSTQHHTIETLLEALIPLDIRARKMFGEYALYMGEKIVALVADEQLFVKPTSISFNYLDNSQLAPPYPGAKLCLLVPDARWTDRAWLTAFLTATAAELPVPPPKKPKRPKVKAGS